MSTIPTIPTLPAPLLRPVRADDIEAMRHFVQGLDAASRRLRFHGGVNPESLRLLQHLVQADGQRHIACVAVLACDDGDVIVGEARCVRTAGTAWGDNSAEFAITVADAWRGRGLAQALMLAVQQQAADAGIGVLTGEVLCDNARMAGLLQRLGYTARSTACAATQTWVRALGCPGKGSSAPGMLPGTCLQTASASVDSSSSRASGASSWTVLRLRWAHALSTSWWPWRDARAAW
jgi:GNAT superfamily N-acetyltransferase